MWDGYVYFDTPYLIDLYLWFFFPLGYFDVCYYLEELISCILHVCLEEE